jgi:pimeloyl-ACP methyl ester carboxylesterase
MRNWIVKIVTIMSLVGALIVPISATALAASPPMISPKPVRAHSSVNCKQYTIPVTLSSSDPTVYHVVGFLCSQGSLRGKTVQFLLHALTYDHNYWDFPLKPGKYSYVRKATDEGYATFNIDRIGIGLSDHPDDTLVTLESNAFVTHQIVQDLRKGIIGDTKFTKIILVGFSIGSNISLLEQSTYGDADGLILSAFSHQFNFTFYATVQDDFFNPVSQDPKFANSGYSSGYYTTVPGTRGKLFYNLPDADPAVIALDETLKQTLTIEENNTFFDANGSSFSQSIHVPVLIALGQNDNYFCGSGLSCADASAILAREAGFWSPQACLEAFVLPNAAHSINLHLNAHKWFESANNWANRRIGSSTSKPPTQPCHN